MGDNIFSDHGPEKGLKAIVSKAESGKGATVSGYYMDDSERGGSVEFGKNGNAISIEEKTTKLKCIYLENSSSNVELSSRKPCR